MVYSGRDGNRQTRPFCCQRDVSRDHLLHVVQRADHSRGVIAKFQRDDHGERRDRRAARDNMV
jgi:hypothetical protein